METQAESKPFFHLIIKSYSSDYDSDSVVSDTQPLNNALPLGLQGESGSL